MRNNLLHHVDPDVRGPKSAWDLLSKQEREIIAPKIKPDQGESVDEASNRMMEVRDANGNIDKDATASNVTAIRNFIDRLGGHRNSAMWRHIDRFNGFTGSHSEHLVVTITDHAAFIRAAKAEGFRSAKVTDWLFSFTPWGCHRHNSIREVTRFSTDFSMHLANDNGDSTYYVHWDPTSVTFAIPTWSMVALENITKPFFYNAERLYRSIAHGSFPSPDEVREQLKKYGQAPSS